MICTIISNENEKAWECKNEHEAPYIALKLAIFSNIQRLFEKGCTDFYVNCEYGIPLWAAEVICALKRYNDISLHLVIPYEEQCKNWHEEHRERYYTVHAKADSIEFAELQYSPSCYQTAEQIMIDRSNAVLLFAAEDEYLFAAEYAASTGKKLFYAS